MPGPQPPATCTIGMSLATGAAGIAFAPNALAATMLPAAAAIRGNFRIFVLPSWLARWPSERMLREHPRATTHCRRDGSRPLRRRSRGLRGVYSPIKINPAGSGFLRTLPDICPVAANRALARCVRSDVNATTDDDCSASCLWLGHGGLRRPGRDRHRPCLGQSGAPPAGAVLPWPLLR